MASTTALYTGLSGLTAHARKLDVVGNNIANVNTISFKQSRMNFENQFPINFKLGAPPNERVGGTNPGQIGLGVRIAGTQRDFRVGSLSPTGDPRDLAIDGDGMFIVRKDGQDFFTRNGAFRLDADGQLTTVGGEVLQGFGVDADFGVIPGVLTDLTVPLGELRIAEPTSRAALAGNVNAGGDVALTGGVTELRATVTDGLRLISGAASFGSSPPADKDSLLVNLADPLFPMPTVPLFTPGQRLELNGAQRGGATIPTSGLTITAATTVTDVQNFLNGALGLHSLSTPNPDGATPGVTIDPLTGVISIVGNTGGINDLDVESADLRLVNADGSLARLPFVATEASDADGESARTTMVAFDTLGNVVAFDVAFTLLSKDGGTGTTWRYDIMSADNAGGGQFLQTGTVQFDALGRLVNPAPITVAIGRNGTGAVDPLTFQLEFTGENGELTALTDTPSEFGGVFRDGLPAGTLERFAIDGDGFVLGSFGNGAVRTLGQVVLAKFTNFEGTVDLGGGLYVPGANSGAPQVVRPGEQATGGILGGTLELSNVDLGQEFINLILTSTGYSASTRVIRTTDELIQQLLLLGR